MVFIESKLFEQLRNNYLSDEQYRQLQNFIMINPIVGDVIKGTGGLRKLRWRFKSKGKRGGIRVIYLFLDKKQHCHFLTIYSKNTISDLTTKEKRLLKQLTEGIKNEQ